MAGKILKTRFFAIEKLSPAILVSLLVGYELISYKYIGVNQITEYLISVGSLYNNYNYTLTEAASRAVNPVLSATST